MSDQSLVAAFSAAIERAFSKKTGGAVQQVDFERSHRGFAKADYDAAMGIAVQAKTAALLKALLSAYLRLYVKYAANVNAIHYSRSDQTFAELFERAAKVKVGDGTLRDEWMAQVSAAKASDLKRRYEELSPTYRSKIETQVPKPKARPKTLLEFLREEYLKRYTFPARDNDALYDFDPAPSPALKASLDASVAFVRSAWAACLRGNETLERNFFHGTLDGFRKFLESVAAQGVLPMFQVIKYMQEPMWTKLEPMGNGTRRRDGDWSPVTCELYAMACLELLVLAQGKLVLPTNRVTFTAEERKYLLKPMRGSTSDYTYISNIEDRFIRDLGDVPKAFELSKTFLDIMLLTQNQAAGASLVPLDQTLRLQRMWDEIRGLTARLVAGPVELLKALTEADTTRILKQLAELMAIEVPLEGRALEIAYAHVGSSPGVHQELGRITIVHIKPPRHFYIEYEGLKPYLFQVEKGYITTKVYASRIYEIYQSTVGMIYVVSALFLMMGFLPVFIEAGFAGLLYEIMVFYASNKVGDEAKKVNPFFGEVVALALQIVVPRPNFKPKVFEPPGLGSPVRPKIVVASEAKWSNGTENPATKQMDAQWLDGAITSMEGKQAVETLPPATAPAVAPKTVPAAASTDTRPLWGHQQLQQQQMKQGPAASAPPAVEAEAVVAKGSKATADTATAGKATAAPATGASTKAVQGAHGTPTPKAPPGNSSIADASFTLTAEQRNFPSKVLTAKTEAAVGSKLEKATGLKAQDAESAAAQPLREQIPEGGTAPPIADPVLLKEPVISDPRYPAPADTLASAKPDYLLLKPGKVEAFEVTLDKSMSIVPKEKGMRIGGAAERAGDPHKQIQVRKTLDYLIRRYPNSSIVYNIQTIGDIPAGMVSTLRTELEFALRLQAQVKARGSVQIIVRGNTDVVIR